MDAWKMGEVSSVAEKALYSLSYTRGGKWKDEPTKETRTHMKISKANLDEINEFYKN